MKKTKRKKMVSAESIARRAEQGKDVSAFFSNAGRMRKPMQREVGRNKVNMKQNQRPHP